MLLPTGSTGADGANPLRVATGLAIDDGANQKEDSECQQQMHPSRPLEHRTDRPDNEHRDGYQQTPIDQLTLLGGITTLRARDGELHFLSQQSFQAGTVSCIDVMP